MEEETLLITIITVVGGGLITALVAYIKKPWKPKANNNNHTILASHENTIIIKNIQKEIQEIKDELAAEILSNDQMNTRLSKLEGMFEMLRK